MKKLNFYLICKGAFTNKIKMSKYVEKLKARFEKLYLKYGEPPSHLISTNSKEVQSSLDTYGVYIGEVDDDRLNIYSYKKSDSYL